MSHITIKNQEIRNITPKSQNVNLNTLTSHLIKDNLPLLNINNTKNIYIKRHVISNYTTIE